MRIHNWLEDLLDSKSKIRIIQLFYQYQAKEFTEREIAEAIGMSPNTVNLALKDIRKTNILFFKKIGKAHAYKLNRDSVLYESLNNIIEGEEKVKKKLYDTIRKALRDSLSCMVFGSFARGEEEFDSDLDLLIISDDKKIIERNIEKLQLDLSESFSITLSHIILTLIELRRKWNKSFLKEARKEGILISGKKLEEIYAEGSQNSKR